jgi:hypothetical protein
MRDTAQYRIQGHGYKCECEICLFDRSSDRRSHVYNICNSEEDQDESHINFFARAPNMHGNSFVTI